MQIDHAEIAKLSLEPGDMLVVKISGPFDPMEVTRCIERAMERAGVRAPIMIGPPGVDFSIIRAPKVPA